MDLEIVAKDAAVIEVDPYRAGFDHDDLVPVRCGAPMTQRGADAGEQFVGVERLGDIVVGAEIERGDLLGAVFACGNDEECCRRSEEHTSELQSLMRIS